MIRRTGCQSVPDTSRVRSTASPLCQPSCHKRIPPEGTHDSYYRKRKACHFRIVRQSVLLSTPVNTLLSLSSLSNACTTFCPVAAAPCHPRSLRVVVAAGRDDRSKSGGHTAPGEHLQHSGCRVERRPGQIRLTVLCTGCTGKC